MIIFPRAGAKDTSLLQETLTIKMLGMPRYNGTFDFSKKKLDVPLAFPLCRSSVGSGPTRPVLFMAVIDDNSVMYSRDGFKFHVRGKNRFGFQTVEKCRRLVTGHGRAFILTGTHMYVYSRKKVRMFRVDAVDVSTSPFGEVFVLSADKILIFDEQGAKEAFPYEGEVRFIHFYLYRELIAVARNQVFHLSLESEQVTVICTTPTQIRSTVLRDRLYIQESTRLTSLNIEDRTTESIYTKVPMNISVGDSMLGLYTTKGRFIFCDRFDLVNAKGIMYDVRDLVGFFFVGSKSYFFFKDRFVMWSNGDVKVLSTGMEAAPERPVVFPTDLEMLEDAHSKREAARVMFRPGKVTTTLHEVVRECFGKREESAKPVGRKRLKYSERRPGGF